MKKRKLFLLPLFCLLLAGCGNSSQSGGDEIPGGDETPAVVNNASLSLAENSMRVDESFTLSVRDIPEGITPNWSKEGNAVNFETNTLKTSAVVTAVEVGSATIKVAVGEKNLTCEITVTESPAQRTPLDTPVISVNADKNGITWAAVEGAEGYLVQVNDGDAVTQTNPGYLFSQTAGTYTVKVTAKADVAEYNSVPAVYDYETKIATVGELSFVNNNTITAASFVGMSLEAKLGDGAYAPVTNLSLAVTADGTYTFHAKGGYDEVNNFFYVEGADAIKSINVTRLTKLTAPVVDVNDDENGLVWEPVAGAVNYSIKVNEEPAELVSDCAYAFATAVGNYHVEIVAKASAAEFDSDKVEFDYETKLTSLGELSFTNNKITWASMTGFGVEAKVGDGAYFDVDPTGLDCYYNYGGNYTFHAVGGFDPDDNIYYAETADSTKTIEVIPEKVIVEDGHDTNNTDLMDRYYVEKYANNGWEPTANPKIFLDSAANEGITPGRCARIHYWANDISYSYSQKIRFVQGYDTMSFYVKGSGDDTSVIVRLIVTEPLTYQGISLTGVRMIFTINNPSTNWTKHTFNIDSDEVQINYGGQNYSAPLIKTYLNNLGIQLTSVGELLPYFDTCGFVLKGHTSNGGERDVYVDEVMFTNDHAETEHKEYIPAPVLKEKYSMTTDNLHGQIKVIDDEHAEATIISGGTPVTIPVGLALNENRLTVTSTVENNDFVLTVASIDAGATWSYVSCTGTLADAMANAKFGELVVLDDFSTYSATGVGYDNSHSADQASGMRANYYCDYYSQTTTPPGAASPVGGNNWWLMGGTDYMDYSSAGCFDAGSAKLKGSTNWRNMRYMSAALAGEATPYAKGFNKLSIMMKGSPDRDVKVMLFGYFGSSLTPSTQQNNRTPSSYSDSSQYITVPQNSDWTEYTINLNAAKAYCGVSIIIYAGNNTQAAYIYVDNIVMYK